jgi:hypothetical protein
MSKYIVPMSSSGHCSKSLCAMLLNYPKKDKPSWLSTTAEEGNLHEDAIKNKLKKEGLIVEDNHQECSVCKERYGTGRSGIHVEIERDKFLLVGHMDGLVHEKDNCENVKILECKSMSQNEFYRWLNKEFGNFPGYANQLSCYMQAIGVYEALYIVKNRNSGQTNRYELNTIPVPFNVIEEKLNNVCNAVDKNELLEYDYDPESIECQRCDYIGLCIPEIKPLDAKTIEEVQVAIGNRELAKKQQKELDKNVDKAEEIIKSYLKATRLKQRAFGWAFSLTLNATRTSYSEKNLILAGVNNEQLEKAANVSEPFDRLWMKNLNEEE